MIKVIPITFFAMAIHCLLAQGDPSSPKLAASWTLDDQAHTTPVDISIEGAKPASTKPIHP